MNIIKQRIFSILLIFSLLINLFIPFVLAEDEIETEIISNQIENSDNENNIADEDNEILEENNELAFNEEIYKENNENLVDNITDDTDDTYDTEKDMIDLEKIETSPYMMLFSTEPNMLTEETSGPTVEYRTHVQNVGWQDYVKNGKTAGTEGRSYRLEAININLQGLSNLKIKYQVHIQNIGWQSWKENGELAGTEGKSLRLEAIKIYLQDTDDYSVQYRVHVQNVGWQEWKTDGELAGTEGKSLRLEAIQIRIISKQKKSKLYLDSPSNGKIYYSSSNIEVVGWKLANISNTTIKAYIDGTAINSNQISYYNRSDVTNHTILYGTPTQNTNAGFKFNIAATDLANGNHKITIDLYSGTEKLNSISSNIKIDKDLHVSYRSHVQNIGWQEYVSDGNMSGTSGSSLRVEAMNINLINAPNNAKILYRTHVQNIGWQEWKSNGQLTGTEGQSLRIEAIQIKLQNMNNYTVEYQVHIQNNGWSNWYIDGETAGTQGKGLRIEAIRIRIVPYYTRGDKGIDVSQYNYGINWGFVKREGIDFAFIRIGFRGYGSKGTLNEDKYFATNVKGAKQAGIPVGVYFITQAITPDEAIQEANWVLNKIKEYNFDINYPIALDIEEAGLENPNDIPRTQNLDRNTRTYLAKLFCETIQNAGYTPMIYTNVYWANNYLNMSELGQYDTWIAHYKDDITSGPSYNREYAIWQYSDSGSINGIFGNVDLNIAYKKY